MKKFFLAFLISSIAFIASPFFSGEALAASKKHNLKIVHTTLAPPSASRDAITTFTKEITEQSNGRITFKVYGSELGDYLEINEMILRGEVDLLLDPIATTFDPRWAALQFPYLVTDYKNASDILGPEGYVTSLFKEWADEKGMHWLGTWMQGFTGVSLNTEATTPEEAKGIKIRSTPIGLVQHVWRNLGFEVSILPYSEVPTAISTGVVSGQAGGGPAQAWNLVRDVNKYYIHYRDGLELWGFVMNKDSWNKLEKEDQELFQNSVNKIMNERVLQADAEEKEYMEKLEKRGLKVIDLIDYPDKLANATELGRKTWPEMEKIIGKEAMDKIRGSLEK